MSSKFVILPERKQKIYDSIYEVCFCGHSKHNHKFVVKTINHTPEVTYYQCEKCVCQKFKQTAKMNGDDYYCFQNRRLLRKEKLQWKIDSIEKELNLMPLQFRYFMDSLEPKTITISGMAKSRLMNRLMNSIKNFKENFKF